MRRYVTHLARYNRWANARLHAAVATLPAEEIARDRGAFFGSILGTLNHILVADRLWLSRFAGSPAEWFQSLDQILYEDFAALTGARQQTDRQILDILPDLPLEGELAYRNVRGEQKSTPWPVVLGHVFNHQTHHRGQAHGLLSQTGVEPPILDLLYFSGEEQSPDKMKD